jgi:hypothetical protein
MIVTERERGRLIKQYNKLLNTMLWKWKRRLNEWDFEELRGDCCMAMSKAIDHHNDTGNNALGTIMGLCINHAIYDWAQKYMADKRKFLRRAFTFTDIEHDNGEYAAGECPEIPLVFIKEDPDWLIMLDKLRETSLLSKDDWFVLDRMSQGYLDKETGVEMGKCKSAVQKRKMKALGKLRIALEA